MLRKMKDQDTKLRVHNPARITLTLLLERILVYHFKIFVHKTLFYWPRRKILGRNKIVKLQALMINLTQVQLRNLKISTLI